MHAGTHNYKCDVSPQEVQYIQQFTSSPHPPAPLEFLELAQEIMNEQSLTMPNNALQALDLYIELSTTIKFLAT